MEIDGRTIGPNEVLQADICIIGAGTAGMTLAHTFINHGCEVLLLESGGLKPEKQSQLLSFGENVGHPYFPLDTARPRGLGGSTNRWLLAMGENQFGARMRPLDPIDFEKREEIPYSGWPFGKTALDPFYNRAEAFCKIIPHGFQLEDWIDPETTPPLPLDRDIVDTVIFKFGSREPFLNEYAEDIRKAINIKLLHHATVLDIEANESIKSIVKVHASSLNDNRFEISAKTYILACGGIETARLLLLSNKQQKTGLGNQNDLVGRFFMEHLHYHSGLFIPSDPKMFRKTALYNMVHSVKGVPILGKLALTEQKLRQENLANYVMELKPVVTPYSRFLEFFYPAIQTDGVESLRALRNSMLRGKMPDDPGRHLSNILLNLNDVSLTISRNLRKRLIRLFSQKKLNVYHLNHMSEQVPNPDSRVTLGQEKDVFGQNRVSLDWRFSPIDIHSAVRSQEIISEELKKQKLGQLFVTMKNELIPHPVRGGWHHMGTTRMNDNPRQGVVDLNCRVHGLFNLYVAGPSVFPTGGYANPCLTLVALTLRLSEHLKLHSRH